MTILCRNSTIELQGDCPVEDAEPLLAALSDHPPRVVDLTAAGNLHTAVFQVLLATNAQVRGPAADAFTESWLMPVLQAGR